MINATEARKIAEDNKAEAISQERIERVLASKIEPAVRASAEAGLSRAVVALCEEDEKTCRAICAALSQMGYSASSMLVDAAPVGARSMCWAVLVKW